MPTFFLDEREVPFSYGQTILDAALSAGHYSNFPVVPPAVSITRALPER